MWDDANRHSRAKKRRRHGASLHLATKKKHLKNTTNSATSRPQFPFTSPSSLTHFLHLLEKETEKKVFAVCTGDSMPIPSIYFSLHFKQSI
jgi:hypothetical protein